MVNVSKLNLSIATASILSMKHLSPNFDGDALKSTLPKRPKKPNLTLSLVNRMLANKERKND